MFIDLREAQIFFSFCYKIPKFSLKLEDFLYLMDFYSLKDSENKFTNVCENTTKNLP